MLGQSLLDLPLHVLTEVLSYLDSIPSLGSAILSHSALYAAYKEQSTNIIECIVLNQIPSDLMPYAVATYDATRVNHRSLDDIVNLLRNYFSDVAPSRHFVLRLEHLEPSAAHLISKTHCAVLHFSNAFVADTLPLTRRRLGYHRSSYARASTIELFRIRRALYRFQLYCNLTFRGENDLRRDREQRLTIYRYQSRFFNYFSPWVNEQFACIHDFLERVLSTSFDEAAAHDIEWGAKSVDWVSRGKQNEYKQAYLSYGLNFLFRLTCRAQSYDQKLEVLNSKGLPRTAGMLAAHFERASLVPDLGLYLVYTYLLRDWTDRSLALVQKPNTDGPFDSIRSWPFQLWFYAHKWRDPRQWVYQPNNSYLRRCGYVIWDAPVIHPKRKPKHYIVLARRQDLIDFIEQTKAKERMRRSWEERAEIYKRGGRGYWSEGDLSKVVWSEEAT